MYIIWFLLILLYLIVNAILTIAMASVLGYTNRGVKVMVIISFIFAGLPIVIVLTIIGIARVIVEAIKTESAERRKNGVNA